MTYLTANDLVACDRFISVDNFFVLFFYDGKIKNRRVIIINQNKKKRKFPPDVWGWIGELLILLEGFGPPRNKLGAV